VVTFKGEVMSAWRLQPRISFQDGSR